jgi:hypothetical protein
MATYVETPDVKVVIDPGVSLAGLKSGYPPHPIELERESEHWAEIKRYATGSDILIVTHYHYDHYNPSEPDLFHGKILFIKHPTQYINKSQADRAKEFLDRIKGIPKVLEYVDGRDFKFGGTTIRFSQSVPHGNIDRLGYVTQVSITDGSFRIVHTSDIEGGNLPCQRDFILKEDPNLLIFDGPMTYPFQDILPNMIRILKETQVEDFIVDHHYVRKTKWREKIQRAVQEGDRLGKRIRCAAEYLGVEPDFLEVRRKELYMKFPPKEG